MPECNVEPQNLVRGKFTVDRDYVVPRGGLIYSLRPHKTRERTLIVRPTPDAEPRALVPPPDTGYPKPLLSADGGYIEKPQDMNRGGTPEFPRREMLVEGPGTETSDDIPAMLSDGEFVMNAKAVRGADPSGNGNRQAGAKNLYDMMRNFEMRA